VKTNSIITDEHVQNRLKEHLRAMETLRRIPRYFMEELNTSILQQFDGAPVNVSLETTRRWMHILRFEPNVHKKVIMSTAMNVPMS
jgi:hypothetical protein